MKHTLLTVLIGSIAALSIPAIVAGEEFKARSQPHLEPSKIVSDVQSISDTDERSEAYTVAPVSDKEYIADTESVNALARMLYGEARGIVSDTEKAACCWCVLNRVDAEGYPSTVIEVVSAPQQFLGYSADHPVTSELYALAEDVMKRWMMEKDGVPDSGRVLPEDYYWFVGDGTHNHFTNEWKSRNYWEWTLESPYES